MNEGVLGGQVVAPHYDDDGAAIRACEALRDHLCIALGNTPFRVWVEREPHLDPQGAYEHMGFALHVEIPDDASSQARAVIDTLPTQFGGFDLFAVI